MLPYSLKKVYVLQGAANVCVGDECVQAGFCSENLCNTIENFKEMANSYFSKTPWSFSSRLSRSAIRRFLKLLRTKKNSNPTSKISYPLFLPNNHEESYKNVLSLCTIFAKQYSISWFITNKLFSIPQINIGYVLLIFFHTCVIYKTITDIF